MAAKAYKIAKSFEYASYPIYQNIKQIRESMETSVSSLFFLLVSTLISTLFSFFPDEESLEGIVNGLKVSQEIKDMLNSGYIRLGIVFIGTLILFLAAFYARRLIKYLSSNKNSDLKRNQLYNDFYGIVIPQVIMGVSYSKQAKEKGEMNSLYAIQALHHINCAINSLTQMNIHQHKTGNKLSASAKKVLKEITEQALNRTLNDAKTALDDISQLCDGELNKKITDLSVNGIFSIFDTSVSGVAPNY